MRGPDAELRAALFESRDGDGEDRVEVEILDLTFYRALAFILNCCRKCNN